MTIELSDSLIAAKGMNEAKFRLELAIFCFKRSFIRLGKIENFITFVKKKMKKR